MDINQISEQLLLKVKLGKPTNEIIQYLKGCSFIKLNHALRDDDSKKAFWINIYNAFFQILRKDGIEKPDIYRKKLIEIAGHPFSLDNIEHGILRKYRFKFSLGYLPNFFTSKTIKLLAVSKIDYRIHFALNCGAESCPPIAFYSPEQLDTQLNTATLSFLESETEYFPDKKEIHISRLFQWYLGDFGGHRGIRKILKEKLQIETSGVKLIYRKYSWEEQLHNFSV
ncbi:MAG: DUF547 domain-containing protein [Bacteroidota bacterium]